MAFIARFLKSCQKVSTVNLSPVYVQNRLLSQQSDVPHQSPIDIKNVIENEFDTPLSINFKTKSSVSSRNTGYCLHVDTDGFINGMMTGGPLKASKYFLQQFHFHWGDKPELGSEHTIDGKMSSAELHYVFKNEKFRNMEEALQQPDGLAVLGVLLKESEMSFNNVMPELFEEVPQIKGNEVKIKESLKLESGLPEDRSYFTYSGSLTTPAYNECVTWILFKNEVNLESGILKRLRNMATGVGDCKILNNWRNTQDIHGRKIYLANYCLVNELA